MAYLATWTDIQLTDIRANELIQGDWRINIGSVDYPEGALRGQIAPIPEPSIYALLAIGSVLLAFRVRALTKGWSY